MSKQFAAEQGVLLDEYIRGYISSGTFFQLSGQIAAMLERVQREGLQIALDTASMQVQNHKVQFQMAVEDSIYDLDRVFEFFKEMAFGCVFACEEDAGEVTDFLHYLDDPAVCASLQDVMEYCLGQDIPLQPMRQEAAHSRNVQSQQGNMRSRSAALQQGNMRAQSAQLQQEPIRSVGPQQGSVQSQNFRPQPQQGNMQPQTMQPRQSMQPQTSQPADGETGVLGAGFWENLEQQYQQDGPQNGPQNGETGVLDPAFWKHAMQNTPSVRLDAPGTGNIVYGRLVNTKTGQATLIKRDNFWIGKEGVDLQINKDVISRRHALLVCKDQHFFLSDNGSTNKTFVNNKEIPARASVEIFNGTRIKFANEEYEFQI